MPDLLELSRPNLEAVFGPENLLPAPAGGLDVIADPDTRDAMRTLGLPIGKNPQVVLQRRLAQEFPPFSRLYDWELPERYDDVPLGAGTWIPLTVIPYDSIVLDPYTGKVFCFPQDGEIYLFNSTFRKFVHFLYILEAELPHYDVEGEGDDDLFDPQGARERVEAAMRAVDPAALADPQSRWHNVLAFIEDPESEYY